MATQEELTVIFPDDWRYAKDNTSVVDDVDNTPLLDLSFTWTDTGGTFTAKGEDYNGIVKVEIRALPWNLCSSQGAPGGDEIAKNRHRVRSF